MLKYVNAVYVQMSSLWQLPGNLYGKCMTTATCVPYMESVCFVWNSFLRTIISMYCLIRTVSSI